MIEWDCRKSELFNTILNSIASAQALSENLTSILPDNCDIPSSGDSEKEHFTPNTSNNKSIDSFDTAATADEGVSYGTDKATDGYTNMQIICVEIPGEITLDIDVDLVATKECDNTEENASIVKKED